MGYAARLTTREVDALRAEGIQPTAEDICWLNVYAMNVEQPSGETDAALRGRPVRCGNVILWPFTLAGEQWYYETAVRHFETRRGRTMALAFALANGPKAGAFDEVLSCSDCVLAVNGWKLKCTATLAELESAIDQAAPQLIAPHSLDVPDDDDKAADVGALVAELVAGTGLDETYWRTRTMSTVRNSLRAVRAQAAAGADVDHDAYKQRNLEFLKAAEAIRRDHTKAVNGG